MKSEIKEWINNKKERAPASHFFKFLYQPTFGAPARSAGGFAKSHEPINFAKEPNLANLSAEQAGALLTSILAMTNWNNYD